MPLCLGASGFVRARQIAQSDVRADRLFDLADLKLRGERAATYEEARDAQKAGDAGRARALTDSAAQARDVADFLVGR